MARQAVSFGLLNFQALPLPTSAFPSYLRIHEIPHHPFLLHR
jgi:hypothetical protein